MYLERPFPMEEIVENQRQGLTAKHKLGANKGTIECT